jgi:hypothetical protein
MIGGDVEVSNGRRGAQPGGVKERRVVGVGCDCDEKDGGISSRVRVRVRVY